MARRLEPPPAVEPAVAPAAPPPPDPPFTLEQKDGKAHVKIKGGNSYVLDTPTSATMFDAIEACGDMGSNDAYVQRAFLFITISEMNGKPVISPASKAELRHLAAKVPPSDLSLLQLAVFGAEVARFNKAAAKN